MAELENVSVDVVIVGAGIGGLAAAQKLAGKGLSVAVLEARDRVGADYSPFLQDGMDLGATVAEAVVSNNQFGFVLMELQGDVWNMSIRGVDGGELLACEIDGDFATCSP